MAQIRGTVPAAPAPSSVLEKKVFLHYQEGDCVLTSLDSLKSWQRLRSSTARLYPVFEGPGSRFPLEGMAEVAQSEVRDFAKCEKLARTRFAQTQEMARINFRGTAK